MRLDETGAGEGGGSESRWRKRRRSNLGPWGTAVWKKDRMSLRDRGGMEVSDVLEPRKEKCMKEE